MATLILTAGVASLGLNGFGLFAASLAATAIGTFIDGRLFASKQNTTSEGPRLMEISLTNSTEGAPIKRLYGRCRIGGTMIWATNFEEVVRTEEEEIEGGKGGGGGATVETTTYEYYCSFAVAFCEGGPCTELGRVWMDAKEVDISKFNWRWHEGTQTQNPDSLIQQVEGADKVPGFRGIAYLVFERLPLADFGNRIPQVTAEINHMVGTANPDSMEGILHGVALIPSSGEFIYSNVVTVKDDAEGNNQSENAHYQKDVTDIEKSLDQMDCALPNVETVNLVVGWFGDDLRAGNCLFKPRVEVLNKDTSPVSWKVNGIVRAGAETVSTDGEGRPIYGGTPSDHSIVQAIQELKSRGYRVCFYPFTLMDIPSGNSLPDPYSNNAATNGQPAFPWRGRITCSPAPGYVGTVDKTATAATQINALFGTAEAANFSVAGTTVSWTGGADWGVRRMILHYALLCKAAGGVDYFCVGTEMVGTTSVRSSASAFPAVTQYADLIGDVKAIGGVSTEVGYAADWSEYHSYRPADGTNDVYFNMDPIWLASDFIGIDNYLPMSDWREGILHLDYDAVNGPRKIYDTDYLASNVEGGEYYDWFYASALDRENQVRTPITDGLGKPWVFRNKDVRNWWLNQHFNRPAGVQSGIATSWIPQNKRVIFTEFGCPAIDKGTNQPNVFYDPKSSESFFPHFSSGQRDDVIQRTYVEVFVKYWRDTGGAMVAHDDMWAWTWDARPYPQFPHLSDVWSDGDNWLLGHWLNGRAGAVTLGAIVTEFMRLVGLENDVDVSELVGRNTIVPGYVVDNIMSPREMLMSLFQAFMFDGYESEGSLKFSLRSDTVFEAVSFDNLVTESSNPGGYSITRQQETELLHAARIDFMDPDNAYQSASASGTKQVGESLNVSRLQFPIVLDQRYARSLADQIVQESWTQREFGEVMLPNSFMRYDPGDGLSFTIAGRSFGVRVTGVENGAFRRVDFLSHEPTIYGGMAFAGRPPVGTSPNVYGRSVLEFLDIPLLTGAEPSPWAPRLAAYQDPFPPAVVVYTEDQDTSALDLVGTIRVKTQMGRTTTALAPSLPWIIHYGQSVRVKVNNPTYQPMSNSETAVLAGANPIAILNDDGVWEIAQFVEATLISGTTYELSGLIRGQLGTEAEMAQISAGARIVFPNPATLIPLGISLGLRAEEFIYRYGPSPNATSHISYQEITKTFRSVGLMPYAPTDLRMIGNSTFFIYWKRRTRFGGDNWDSEPPLNETSEKYEIDFLGSGGSVVHTKFTTLPQTSLNSGEQSAYYGGPQTSIRVRIFQISELVGRGHAADEILISTEN